MGSWLKWPACSVWHVALAFRTLPILGKIFSYPLTSMIVPYCRIEMLYTRTLRDTGVFCYMGISRILAIYGMGPRGLLHPTKTLSLLLCTPLRLIDMKAHRWCITPLSISSSLRCWWHPITLFLYSLPNPTCRDPRSNIRARSKLVLGVILWTTARTIGISVSLAE